MAYTFNSINSQLDGNEKLDMFNQQAPKAKPQFGGSSANGNVQLGSSGSGSVSSTAQPTGSAPAQASGSKSPSSYNPGAAQAAYSGIGPVDSSQQTGKISGDIASANQKLQDEANAYSQKVTDTAKGYSLDKDTLEKAASGDDAAFQTTASRLAKTQADPIESFQGLSGDDVTKLQSSTSALEKPTLYGDIYRPSASANYGSGESRFNSILLGMDPNFRREANKLISDRRKVVSDVNASENEKTGLNDTMKIDLTKKANETLTKAYADATGQIRNDLIGMSDEVMSAAEKRAVEETAIRAGLDPKKISAQEAQTILQRLKAETLNDKTPLSRGIANANNLDGLDLSSYLNIDRDVTADEILTQAEIERFNRINGLLGSGNLKTLNQQGGGPQYTFNTQGAEAAIKAYLEGQQGAADRLTQDQIDKIVQAATGRASADPGDALQNAKDFLTNRYLNQNEGQSAQEQAIEKYIFDQIFTNPATKPQSWDQFLDPSSYHGDIPADYNYLASQGAFPAAQARTWQDMLTAAEAQELTRLSSALGTNQQYAAGSMNNDLNFNRDYFQNNFDTGFQRIMDQLSGKAPVTPQELVAYQRAGINPMNYAGGSETIARGKNAFDETLNPIY